MSDTKESNGLGFELPAADGMSDGDFEDAMAEYRRKRGIVATKFDYAGACAYMEALKAGRDPDQKD